MTRAERIANARQQGIDGAMRAIYGGIIVLLALLAAINLIARIA